jgi:sugar lactone lactonase YvrE
MKTGTFGRLFFSLAALTTLLVVSSTLAAPGDLYVSDVVGKQILKYTPSGSKSVFASGLDEVGQLAFDRTGNLFMTESSQGVILKFALDGTESTFVSGLSLPGWPAFDGADNLFITESFGDTGDILRCTPSGTKSTFASGGYFSGLCFDSAGNLFAATAGPTNPNGGIVYYSPDGTVHTFFEMVNGPGAIGPDLVIEGEHVYTTTSDMILMSSDPLPGLLPSSLFGPFAIGLDGPLSLALDSAGNLFV